MQNCLLVFQSKESNVCTHCHLAQTVGVKIKLGINPLSEVLQRHHRTSVLAFAVLVQQSQSHLINRLEFL